jgi:hypothetical protein
LSGETNSTCVSSGNADPARRRRSIAHRNAASVFPVPVGAAMSVCLPSAIAGQPRTWGSEGEPIFSVNQRASVG